MTYTLIKTWDNRRLVVPNSVFSNEVIENWTIKDPSLLGEVILFVDYTCDIGRIQDWVQEIVKESDNSTEEKIGVVQVVDFTEKTMKVRILAQGPDAPATWNLRCEIREELIGRFIKRGLPLPQFRVFDKHFGLFEVLSG